MMKKVEIIHKIIFGGVKNGWHVLLVLTYQEKKELKSD